MILARIHLSAATTPAVIPHREHGKLELRCAADAAGGTEIRTLHW
jgi:hypothetical protein